MHTRTPAVAGMFYPDKKIDLKKTIHDCNDNILELDDINKNIKGIICPHAGLNYSGYIACQSFNAISNNEYDVFIICGPNHWGLGCNISTMKDASWETPLGNVTVDSKLVDDLIDIEKIIEIDTLSHSKEHSIEVQIPIIQETFSNMYKILPISMIDQSEKTAITVGKAIAKIATKQKTMIIGSSDFTHYETNDFAYKQDAALIEPILKLDVKEFYKILKETQSSACGYGAIAATMTACKELGATSGNLLRYATSGDITQDKDAVVGYGAIALS